MKMNKKGFTLIEMLVVIAIIAVLVSIIIPTVSSATVKAGAAANAANLRAVYAEVQTDILSIGNGTDNEGYVHWTNGNPTLSGAPTAAATTGCDKGTAMQIATNDAGDYVVTYNNHDISYFAAIAETGKAGS